MKNYHSKQVTSLGIECQGHGAVKNVLREMSINQCGFILQFHFWIIIYMPNICVCVCVNFFYEGKYFYGMANILSLNLYDTAIHIRNLYQNSNDIF